jgi:pimeloyl-ACP methyl ester carboxylesterase
VEHQDGRRDRRPRPPHDRVQAHAADGRPGDERTLRVGGQLVRYRTLGEGPPVLLVHGLGGSARWWDRTAPALAARHRVIAPALPGFGWSMGGSSFRLGDAPALLLRLVERLGGGPVRLVGHSLGAIVCLGLAAREPRLVERLVLIAPPVRTAGSGLLAHALPVLGTLLRLPPAAALTVAADVARCSPAALLAAAGDLLMADHAEDLAAVRAPTLLLWGSRDTLVPAAGAADLARAMPGARLRVIRGAGHVPMLDRPGEVNRELLSFLGDGTG